MNAFEKLRQMAAEQLGIDENEIKPESRLKEDLQADSASVLMLVMDIENEFDAYIDHLKSMGMDRVVEIKQATLDAYNAR